MRKQASDRRVGSACGQRQAAGLPQHEPGSDADIVVDKPPQFDVLRPRPTMRRRTGAPIPRTPDHAEPQLRLSGGDDSSGAPSKDPESSLLSEMNRELRLLLDRFNLLLELLLSCAEPLQRSIAAPEPAPERRREIERERVNYGDMLIEWDGVGEASSVGYASDEAFKRSGPIFVAGEGRATTQRPHARRGSAAATTAADKSSSATFRIHSFFNGHPRGLRADMGVRRIWARVYMKAAAEQASLPRVRLYT